ncbi:MAG: DUF1007 domain-containing protein, partial [Campylobacter sp.]|nr:DUF1007 domain-containing protein [Campylobacter sp.]
PKIGFLHVIGAFLIGLLMYVLLSGVSANYANDAGKITTATSAVAIIAISIYMLYKKIKFHQKAPILGNSYIFSGLLPSTYQAAKALNIKFKPTKSRASQCACEVCARDKNASKSYREWLIAAAAALIPCPGTILVFVLAHELGSYFAGFMSGVFMALGMSVVIFIAAIFGAKFNYLSELNRCKIYTEYLALAVMFGLGVFMLFTTMTQVSVF